MGVTGTEDKGCGMGTGIWMAQGTGDGEEGTGMRNWMVQGTRDKGWGTGTRIWMVQGTGDEGQGCEWHKDRGQGMRDGDEDLDGAGTEDKG